MGISVGPEWNGLGPHEPNVSDSAFPPQRFTVSLAAEAVDEVLHNWRRLSVSRVVGRVCSFCWVHSSVVDSRDFVVKFQVFNSFSPFLDHGVVDCWDGSLVELVQVDGSRFFVVPLFHLNILVLELDSELGLELLPQSGGVFIVRDPWINELLAGELFVNLDLVIVGLDFLVGLEDKVSFDAGLSSHFHADQADDGEAARTGDSGNVLGVHFIGGVLFVTLLNLSREFCIGCLPYKIRLVSLRAELQLNNAMGDLNEVRDGEKRFHH